MSPLKSKGKNKNGQSNKGLGSQDQAPIRNNLGNGFTKKRNFEAFQEGSDALLSGTVTDGVTSVTKHNKHDLWTTKYTPFNLVSYHLLWPFRQSSIY